MIPWHGLGATVTDDGADDDLVSHQPQPAGGPARLFFELPVLLVLAAVIALVVKAFLAQAFFIPSASMEPQLTAGDRVVVSRTAYRLHEPRRGDVVVFPDPTVDVADDDSFLPLRVGREALEALGLARPDGRELIKRVIGLPGETVSASGGTVYIDGKPLFEPYLAPEVSTQDFPAQRVPDGHLFMMGDNRSNSKDSRRFGPVPDDSVVGRAIARVWPPGRVAFL